MGCGTCYASDNDATMVLTCLACKHARPSGFVSCSLTGKPLVSNAPAGGVVRSLAGLGQPCAGNPGCPINAKPDEHGRTRWAGFLWRGVAWPLRFVMADDVLAGWLLKLPRPAAINDFPGCGCLDRLKSWMERLGSAWHSSAAMRTAFLAAVFAIVLALFFLVGCSPTARTEVIPGHAEVTRKTTRTSLHIAPGEKPAPKLVPIIVSPAKPKEAPCSSRPASSSSDSSPRPPTPSSSPRPSREDKGSKSIKPTSPN